MSSEEEKQKRTNYINNFFAEEGDDKKRNEIIKWYIKNNNKDKDDKRKKLLDLYKRSTNNNNTTKKRRGKKKRNISISMKMEKHTPDLSPIKEEEEDCTLENCRISGGSNGKKDPRLLENLLKERNGVSKTAIDNFYRPSSVFTRLGKKQPSIKQTKKKLEDYKNKKKLSPIYEEECCSCCLQSGGMEAKKKKSVRFGMNRLERSASGDEFRGPDYPKQVRENRKKVDKTIDDILSIRRDIKWANDPNGPQYPPPVTSSSGEVLPSRKMRQKLPKYQSVKKTASKKSQTRKKSSRGNPEKNRVSEEVLEDALKKLEQDGGNKNRNKKHEK